MILDADYQPPARRGDFYRYFAKGVEAMILIDGIFHSEPAVWQREILEALDEGFQVFGASSMGALRAAELHPLGMVGHGVVFEWYRDGVIDGDDEVALLHGAEDTGYRGMSEPLVNIRYNLQRAVEERWLTAEQARALAKEMKKLHYPERSYRRLLASGYDLARRSAGCQSCRATYALWPITGYGQDADRQRS
jgi:hypothetical protein